MNFVQLSPKLLSNSFGSSWSANCIQSRWTNFPFWPDGRRTKSSTDSCRLWGSCYCCCLDSSLRLCPEWNWVWAWTWSEWKLPCRSNDHYCPPCCHSNFGSSQTKLEVDDAFWNFCFLTLNLCCWGEQYWFCSAPCWCLVWRDTNGCLCHCSKIYSAWIRSSHCLPWDCGGFNETACKMNSFWWLYCWEDGCNEKHNNCSQFESEVNWKKSRRFKQTPGSMIYWIPCHESIIVMRAQYRTSILHR